MLLGVVLYGMTAPGRVTQGQRHREPLLNATAYRLRTQLTIEAYQHLIRLPLGRLPYNCSGHFQLCKGPWVGPRLTGGTTYPVLLLP